MKLAIMLALHNNPEQANVFIDQCLTSDSCEVFIHIDKKALNIGNELRISDRVHILPHSFEVEWGDFSQIQYVLYMMQYIRDFARFDYYSIHSGSDLLVRPMAELESFLESSHKYAYLDCHMLPWDKWQYGGGMGRLELIWPKWMRKRLDPHSLKRYIRAVYGRLYCIPFLRKRKLPEDAVFYGKSAWYTLREDCVKNLLDYLDNHNEFLKLFEGVLCGDEIFFNTVIYMSAGEHTEEIEQHNNLRYDDLFGGDKRNVGGPRIIRMSDIDEIGRSGAFFARKADSGIDSEVIQYYKDKIQS